MVNKRISYIRLKNNYANISVVNVYALTEKSSEDEKQEFFDKLEKIYDTIPKHNTIIIVGDLNAKIRKKEYYKEVAGKYTIHEEMNDNGVRICNFAG